MPSAVATPVPFQSTAVPDTAALDAPTLRRLLRVNAAIGSAADGPVGGVGSTGSTNSDDWRVRVVQTTGSTNSDLLASVRADGFDAPTLLAAERQTAGRGRLGRGWDSAAGASLTASFALRVERPMGALDGVTLVCGLAVLDAIALHGVEAWLKWPNDVLVDGRKLAGILVETSPVVGGTVLVVGVGINVVATEQPVDATGGLAPAHLHGAGAHDLDRNRLAAALATALQARLGAFANGGFACCLDAWNRRDAYRDRRVALQASGDRLVTGIARGVDSGGALLVETADGLRRIVSGDLSLRLATTP